MYDPGLHTIYGGLEGDPPGHAPEIDIVAVHGLNFKNNPNHARATWSSRGSLWIRDFLPSGIQRPSRIFLFAYNSSPAMGAAGIRIDEHAKMLLRCLKEKREGCEKRPLMFICHSLGGIVVKSALVEGTLDPAYRSIVQSTQLLVFFATPHQGGNYSGIGDIAAKIVRTSLQTPANDLLDGLKSGSRDVVRRFEQSRHLPERCLVVSFYETENYGRLGLIVDKQSAILHLPEDREKQIALKANHSTVCKFPTAESCEPIIGVITTELERSLELQRAHEPGPENAHWLVSRSINPLFTGRDDVVKRVMDAIIPSQGVDTMHQKRFVLTGLGGQGKSEVCLNVAHRLRMMFWGVFWVDVGNPSTAASGFSRIARLLGSNATDIDDTLVLLANCNAKQNWLLVLDNADDVNTDYQQYLPSGTRGTVLLTSRLPECHLHSTVGFEELGNLGLDDCVDLLLKAARVPESLRSEHTQSAEAIANELGCHTLALLHAGAYIATGHCSMVDYLTEFRHQQNKLLQFSLSQAQSRYQNVYATFEASIQVLEVSSGLAQDSLQLLDMLSSMHYEDIPLDFFTDSWKGVKAVREHPNENDAIDCLCDWHVTQLPDLLNPEKTSWNDDRLNLALEKLCSLALVKKSNFMGSTVLSLHPLTHSWLAVRQEAQRWTGLQTSCCVFALWAYANAEWKVYRDRLGPHISFLLSAPSFINDAISSAQMRQAFYQIAYLLQYLRHDDELADLLKHIFKYFNAEPNIPTEPLLPLYYLAALNEHNLGNFKQSINLISGSLKVHRDSTKSPNRRVFEKELGRAFISDGQIKRAITLLEEMDKIQSSQTSEDDPTMITLRYELGVAYRADGQTEKAITVMEEVMRNESNNTPEDGFSRVAPAYELAKGYLADNRLSDAINLFNRTLRLAGKQLNRKHPNRLALQDGLGRALLSNGQTAQAIEIFEEIVDIEKASLVPNHPSRLVSLHILGSAYKINGQIDESIALFEEILRLSRFDESHPNRLDAQVELSSAYIAAGQSKKALKLLKTTIHIQESAYDESHPSRLRAQIELAKAYKEVGQLSQAIPLLQRAVALQEVNLDEGDPNRIMPQYLLGLAYLDNGQLSAATSILEEVVRIEDIAVNDNAHQQAISKHALGRAYLTDGRTNEAIDIFEEVVDTLSRSFVESHPDVLASEHELGRSYVANGQLNEAIEIFENIIRIQSSSLNANHPDQMASKRMLGIACVESGQATKAITIFQGILKIEQAALDKTHAALLSTQSGLARGYLANNQVQEAIELFEEVVRFRSMTQAADHPELLQSKQQLGAAYLARLRTDDAVAVLEDVVSVYSKDYKENHPMRLIAYHKLALAYIQKGEHKEGMVILEDVVRNQAHLDQDHPSRLASEYELGRCYLNVRKTEDSVRILENVVKVESSSLGSDNPSRLVSVRYLGMAYLANGQTDKAIERLQEIVLINEKTLGESNLSTLASKYDLAVAYSDDGKIKKAIIILQDILETEKQTLEANHTLRLKTQFDLASTYLDTSKAKKAIPLLEELNEIIRTHVHEGSPTLAALQRELARAHRRNKFLSRMMAQCGISACIGSGQEEDMNLEDLS